MLDWVAICFSRDRTSVSCIGRQIPYHWATVICTREKGLVTQLCPTLCDPWTVACQASRSMEFSRQDSAQFSHSVVSNSLRHHELQHPRPPCPSPTPGVHPNPCPLSWWCHPTTSSSVVPVSSCPQSFPASESFPMSQLFASDGQSIGVSASTSVHPMNTQDWSPLGWTGWISLQSNGLSRVFSNTTVQKHQFFGAQLSL